MAKKKTYKETVNYGRTTEFHRYLHEVTTEDGMNLIMTHKVPVGKKSSAPVVMVHGLGQNRYSWTLTKRSMENYLVSQGFETFNVELRGHGLSRANGCEYPTRFETYLFYDMPAILEAVREITNRRKMFYIGHSLGAAISYCIGARFQDYLAGIISIAGPFSMGQGNLTMKLLARAGVIVDRITPFRLLHPEAFYIDFIGFVARYGLFALDNRFNRFPIQVWYPGSIERDILTERIEKGFDRTSFTVFWLLVEWTSSGKLHSSDKSVDFEEQIAGLKIPILFVIGDRDYAVPVASVKEAHEKAASEDKTLKVFGGEAPGLHWGHCDLICGQHAPRIVWPYLLEWMQTRLPRRQPAA
jgi:pimeloyl-ACP methyl ester carboxylesterase